MPLLGKYCMSNVKLYTDEDIFGQSRRLSGCGVVHTMSSQLQKQEIWNYLIENS